MKAAFIGTVGQASAPRAGQVQTNKPVAQAMYCGIHSGCSVAKRFSNLTALFA